MAGMTISNNQTSELYDPTQTYAPILYLRKEWADHWEIWPELRLTSGTVQTASHGRDEIHVVKPYGPISHPWEKTFGPRLPVDLRGWWIRLDLIGPSGPETEFVGRIMTETRQLDGNSEGRSGDQSFTGYGPGAILDRLWFHSSFWHRLECGGSGSEDHVEIDWVPDVNRRARDGTLLGNRSEDPITSVDDELIFGYGGDADWTHLEYLKYLLHWFVDESDSGGPKWRLAGQTDALENLITAISLEASNSVGEVIAQLIDPKHGIDYFMNYWIKDPDDENSPEGFEISIFALVGEEITFNGYILPENSNRITYKPKQDPRSVRTVIERNDAEKYNTIRVVGRRAVCCCSIGGDECELIDEIKDIHGLLGPRWLTTVETLYKQGLGDGAPYSPDQHDRARQHPKFERVYQAWSIPWDGTYKPEDLGHTAGFTFEGDFWDHYAEEASRQTRIRNTLNWLPLREGVDYSGNPPYDESESPNYQSALLRPMVWVCGNLLDLAEWVPIYERADTANIGVRAPDHDWGVTLSCTPNHLVAEDRFYEGGGTKPTSQHPLYHSGYMAATIAFECDQRVTAEYTVDADLLASGGTKEIYDDDIECWILAPYTILGVEPDGTLITSGSEVKIIRDDHQRIGRVMAGAIARYARDRSAATIEVEGVRPWSKLRGYILAAIEEGGDTHKIEAPITSIQWLRGMQGQIDKTIIRTGYAR